MGCGMADSEILLTGAEITEFARAGDKEALEQIADELLIFLQTLDNLPDDLMRAASANGVVFMEKSTMQFLMERLQEKEAKRVPGKTNKSGRELFCKFLSPKKPTTSQKDSFGMAHFAWLNLRPNGKLSRCDDSFETLANTWNDARKNARMVLAAFKEGRIDLTAHCKEIGVAKIHADLPFATANTFKRAWLKYRRRFDGQKKKGATTPAPSRTISE